MKGIKQTTLRITSTPTQKAILFYFLNGEEWNETLMADSTNSTILPVTQHQTHRAE